MSKITALIAAGLALFAVAGARAQTAPGGSAPIAPRSGDLKPPRTVEIPAGTEVFKAIWSPGVGLQRDRWALVPIAGNPKTREIMTVTAQEVAGFPYLIVHNYILTDPKIFEPAPYGFAL